MNKQKPVRGGCFRTGFVKGKAVVMKALGLGVVIGAMVALSGCGTDRVSEPEVVSTTTTEAVVATKVVETTTVPSSPVSVPVVVPAATASAQTAAECGQRVPASQGTDILQGARKPCGTIAADAPKFVTPEQK